MSPQFAALAFVAIVVAEVLYRLSEVWESIGRAVTLPCPCGGCAR